VMVNVSRGLAAPITLEPDHNDILAARDSGFLQIHCATCQEVLDTTLMAYRLAEDPRVRLPVIVNEDGFYLSFTREPVAIPDAEQAAAFVGEFDAENIKFRASAPSSQAVAVLGGTPYSYFRYEIHRAVQNSLTVHQEICEEFAEQFGRHYDAIESYQVDDAEYVFVIMGCFATKAKAAVDSLRAAGWKIGLLRPRLIRPFPAEDFRRKFAGKKAVAVIDQNISMGKGGILHTELRSELYGLSDAPPIVASFMGGLGGRDISQEEFFQMATVLREAVVSGETPEPRLLYTETELRQMHKLQAIAHVEREELGEYE
ncbi:MAG: pyruvate synthase, partial [Gammaproteobacteria bacterium]|nr:pyruvate synthase [Gammaproteobacteria bacterium]